MTTENSDITQEGRSLDRLVRCAFWAWLTAGALMLAGWVSDYHGAIHGAGTGAFLMATFFKYQLERLSASNSDLSSVAKAKP